MDGVFLWNILAKRYLASTLLCTWTVKGRSLGIAALQTQTFRQVESSLGLGCRWCTPKAMLSDPTFVNNKVNILSIGWVLICSLLGEEDLVLFMSPPQKCHHLPSVGSLNTWTGFLSSPRGSSRPPNNGVGKLCVEELKEFSQRILGSRTVLTLSEILCSGYLNSSSCSTEDYFPETALPHFCDLGKLQSFQKVF